MFPQKMSGTYQEGENVRQRRKANSTALFFSVLICFAKEKVIYPKYKTPR